MGGAIAVGIEEPEIPRCQIDERRIQRCFKNVKTTLCELGYKNRNSSISLQIGESHFYMKEEIKKTTFLACEWRRSVGGVIAVEIEEPETMME